MSNGKECCTELIDEIISNEATQYTEDHRGMLEELPEDVLKVMIEVPKVEKEEIKDSDAGITEEPSNDEVIQAAVQKRIDEDPVMQEQKRLYDMKRTKIIEGLIANKRNTFTKEELDGKTLRELEGLASLAKVDVDYSLNAANQETIVNEEVETEMAMPKESELWTLHNLQKGQIGRA